MSRFITKTETWKALIVHQLPLKQAFIKLKRKGLMNKKTEGE